MRSITEEWPEKPNVIIVGAGPVGVLAANLLGQQGIPVLLIDQNPGVLEIPRAISLDQDALRILQAAGFGEQISKSMPAISSIEMISPFSGIFAKINSAGSMDGHPRLVSIYQPELERILRKGLTRFPNVRLWSECTYITHTETDSEIIVRVRCKETEYRITGAYLLGSDGAHSKVREKQGWRLKGSAYKEDWLILDVANLPETLDKVEFICDPKRPIAHVPGPNGSQRWEFLLRDGETKEEMETPMKVSELMKPWGDVSSMKLERIAVYRFQAKTADCMGKGRVFLLGDAAHLTPPFAGQGLVSGIRDTFNLSWKIAAVLKKKASPKILFSYNTERKPHAKKMIRLAVFLGSIIMTRSKIKAFFRDLLFKFLHYTPLRPYLSDLRIRPQNSFKKGLFLKRETLSKCNLYPGSLFPQAPVRSKNGSLVLSDDLFEPALYIVGYGKHPHSILDSSSSEIWNKMGGKILYISNQQKIIESDSFAPEAEDVTSSFFSAFGGLERFAIVRPDKIVAAVFSAQNADQVVRKFTKVYQGSML
ncbi:bifunctional 3-(3-hydroxy-phenyl)propionate/3-hydroxycinnamic acid hydroxylase [Leptospira venezuelensis]|uniref:bifunctional 3-(3-hydroxy-phenyl)propionate/3-hydroxycinnamic acid hydroxylase n=1 Tax=Leptospira venezuelensis TaxID=1958811 RepID=UPI001F334346|nr:bifunctional 3-(3-hydroxy-phenyl)propionate/3-hydroxycinnamic acid hydroxylase [Leptospira venezuelensis]